MPWQAAAAGVMQLTPDAGPVAFSSYIGARQNEEALMDLGIRGKTALVCAASKGIGKGCAMALAQEGVKLVILARGRDALEATADEIRKKTGVEVRTLACDITSREGHEAALAACPDPDILVNNAGGPPPGDFREWDRDTWIKALDANMLTPIELIRRTVDGMIRRRFGRIVNITSSSVKAPIDILGLSNGARSGLTGFVAGLARKTVPHNVTINAILPGAIETDRLRSNFATVAKNKSISVEQARAERITTIPAGRFGTIEEFGAMCAFLCSQQASYITGQNWLCDGGMYPGTY
jgi:3-oxoacyl-[acyl-carrier protein] reductase